MSRWPLPETFCFLRHFQAILDQALSTEVKAYLSYLIENRGVLRSVPLVVLLLKTNHQKVVLEASDWALAVLCMVHLVNLNYLH